MQRKDLMELKKRFKKDQCTFTRMTGCYVNSQKEKVVTLNEVFLNLPDEEYYKSKSDIIISNNGEDLNNQINFIQEG